MAGLGMRILWILRPTGLDSYALCSISQEKFPDTVLLVWVVVRFSSRDRLRRRTAPNPEMMTMRVPTLENLRALIACEEGSCVSLYLPTVVGGSPDDRRHFHAELTRLRDQLAASHPARVVAELLSPLEALSTADFWSQAKSTLVAFRSQTTLAHWHLPLVLPERAVVGAKTHVRPLLTHLQSNRGFYLLRLNDSEVRLHAGSAFGLEPVELPLALDPACAKLQAAGPFAAAEVEASVGIDPLRRIRAIERAVAQVVSASPRPLLVAAPERELWMFRSVARFDDMIAFGLVGDLGHLSLDAMHARAWPVVEQHLDEQNLDVLDRWGALSGANRASDDLSIIARATTMGRVRELILDREAVVHGRLDRSTGTVQRTVARGPREDANVLEELAESVCLHGGEVFRLRHDRMPTRSPIAATLRW